MSEARKKRCWPWSHQWSQWEDFAAIEKSLPGQDKPCDIGVEQRRRCTNCNKLKSRIEWAKK